MARRGLPLVLLSGAALAAVLIPSAGEAYTVPVRGADRGTFVRIVFDWPVAGVKVSAAVSGNRLLVNFGEPVETTLQPIVQIILIGKPMRKIVKNDKTKQILNSAKENALLSRKDNSMEKR